MSSNTVTLVGAGNIGAAMVKTWLNKGFAVTMWNRNPNRPMLAELVKLGAVFEHNLRAAIARSDTIVICVATYENIKEFLSPILPLGESSSSKIFVNISTGTPQQAREMGSWLSFNSISAYIDGAIMVTPELIGTEHSSIYLSGANEAKFQEASKILESIGKLEYVSEDPGAASLWDLSALAAMDGMYYGAFLAMNLLKRQRATAGDAKAPSVEVPMQKIVVPLMSSVLPHILDIAKALDDEDWGQNHGNSVSMQIKGLQTIIDGVRQEKVNTDGLELFHQMMKRTLKEKGGDAGMAAMGTLLLED